MTPPPFAASPAAAPPARVRLFGLDILRVDLDAAAGLLADAAASRGTGARVVVTPNVDHIVRLERQPAFKASYATADFIFADGMPLVWFSRLMGAPLPGRVTGSDLFIRLCRHAELAGLRVGLIGGMPGQEADLRARFAQYYPGLDIDILSPSMQFDPTGEEGLAAADWIRRAAPDIVFVCLGLPKQERWALHHGPSLPGGILLCVGAAMEFAIGLQKRAPARFQRWGMEWLWRLASNPRRLWRRYLVDDPAFLRLCWREWRHRHRTNRPH